MPELSKVYEPKEVEARLYRAWEEGGYFTGVPDPSKQPFCIAIPPPNVTGALHTGHALDNTLQDILIRFKRMNGFAALWIPGTDHAGIATQNVVERELKKEGLSRHDLGREKFVERVWEWKAEYGDRIIEQLKRLGSSADWSRERFTMDPGLSRAVRKVFVDLFDEGLIYRGNRIINWCPRCETALSDIEVNHIEHEGELVRFRYPLEDPDTFLTVATTRVETMLGDTGIAVHPDDPRYADVIGKFAVHPFHGRKIPIVGDEAVDMSFGTGAVKMTPAHDQTDFEIAERHGLEKINIFDGTAHVNDNGGAFAGMERFEARAAVRAALEAEGLLDGADPHVYSIGHCDRCNTIVEPWLSEQWFVKMQPLAEPAIQAVKDGRTKFYPDRWTNFYLNWMQQIRDWCISRQLWWGHRIPVWYCDACQNVWAATDDPATCAQCSSADIRQDPDVLDTWFSSQLWPFSTLGWPERTEDLAYWYPTDVIVPGYDIIHLWVSRMIMAGLHFMNDVPFRWAYIHGIVRDAKGQKMSKSLGNVLDPLTLVDKYGADALRFTLAERATGQDIFLHEEWLEGSRNFANKLWNASRFVLMNIDGLSALQLPPDDRLELSDRWILSRLAKITSEVTGRIDSFEVSIAARSLFEFIWNEYCDWYIEAAKRRLYGEDPAAKNDVKHILLYVLERTLRLLHPIMPFITEEIWGQLPFPKSSPSIMVAAWPEGDPALVDEKAERDFASVRDIVSALRRFRSDHRIDLKAEIEAHVSIDDEAAADLLSSQTPTFEALARHFKINLGYPAGGGPEAKLVVAIDVSDELGVVANKSAEIVIPLQGILDVEEETARLGKQIAEVRAEMGRFEAKLSNAGFISKAPSEVVAEQRQKLETAKMTHGKLVSQLEQLGL